VKQAMLASASHVIAVTTADKLGAVEPFVVAPCNRVHTLITERHVASGNVEDYQKTGDRGGADRRLSVIALSAAWVTLIATTGGMQP